MGSKTACKNVASVAQVWYAHYDKLASFSDYTTIGGWSRPNIKQYQGDTTLWGWSRQELLLIIPYRNRMHLLIQ